MAPWSSTALSASGSLTLADTWLAEGIAARVRPGDGDGVLWLHGYTMNGSIWAELWDLLPSRHHIGIDLPGHGGSAPIRQAEDLSVLARRLGEAAAAAGVRHVVGLSFGTILALQVAIELPNAFQTLALAAPALAGGPQDPASAERYVELMGAYRTGASGQQLAALWMRSPPDIFKSAEAHPDLHARLADVIATHGWQELETGSMLQLMHPAQTTETLHRVQASTAVIVGDLELPAFRRCAEIIVGGVAGASFIELREAGHLCLLERPREAAHLLDVILAP